MSCLWGEVSLVYYSTNKERQKDDKEVHDLSIWHISEASKMTTVFLLEGAADTLNIFYSYFQAMQELAIRQPEYDFDNFPYYHYYVREMEITEN